ncbi:MAG: RsmE family RNA methyltransferase [Thermogutta sp.]
MSQRFFIGRAAIGDHVTLEGDEAHHLVRVMRAQPGDKCTLFDGTGCEYRAEVAEAASKRVRLRILDRRAVDRELPFRVTVAAPLPKGDRERFLVEKLTELGITTFVPLITARAVVRPSAAAVRRLERTVIEASKQCGRNRLMQVAAPADLRSFLSASAAADMRWLAQPGGQPREPTADSDARERSASPLGGGRGEAAPANSLPVPSPEAAGAPLSHAAHVSYVPAARVPSEQGADVPFPQAGRVSLPQSGLVSAPQDGCISSREWGCVPSHEVARVAVVGPEGGFTTEELEAAASLGWRFVDLGPRIMRIETAAIVLAVQLTSQNFVVDPQHSPAR